MIKIGMMSFAHMHAFSYATCLKQLPNAELTAIWDDNAARGKQVAERLGTKFVRGMDAFLALDTDAVIIASENVKHRAMVEAAAQAKKWILCEKPLATTVADAKAMVAACKKAKVGLGTAFPCRWIPAVAALRDQVAGGALGQVYAAMCTNNGRFPGGWFADEKLSGGGATMDHTVHVVDLLRWITGREVVKVYCENGTFFQKGVKVDDLGSLHFEFDDGMIASHIASWNRPESFPTWGDVTLEVIAEKGVVTVDALNQKLLVCNDAVGKAQYAYWGGDMDLGLIRDFVDAVANRRAPSVTGEDGLRAVAVAVAAYESARGKKVVKTKA